LVSLKLKKHIGVVLEPSIHGFDAGASTFCCVYEEKDERKTYLFYTGSVDPQWNTASIGVAKSLDGINFTKVGPIITTGVQSVTPAIFKAFNRYYMVYAFKPSRLQGRRLAIAVSDNLEGPWKFIQELIKPEHRWEGKDIDIGPSVVSLSQNEFLIYYSNVSNKFSFKQLLFGPKIYRQIGILKLRILEHKILAERFLGNPLSHLNGPKGSWNESLFCPGYLRLNDKHYLLPSASTYSIGFPYKQYIGLMEDSSPFFEKPKSKNILIDGPKMKNQILPRIKSEIALDTPSPLAKGNEVWLYYSVMDRADNVWKTALSIFQIT
jgi:hypothetical protein